MAKAPRLRKDWTRGPQRTRKLSTGKVLWSWRKGQERFVRARRETAGAKPYTMQVVRTVVCPGKASVFSRRQTYQGKSQSPVARRAGGRETNLLKPLDSLICGMGASLQAVAQANAQVAPKVRSPGGRACNREGEGSMSRRRLADAADHSGG